MFFIIAGPAGRQAVICAHSTFPVGWAAKGRAKSSDLVQAICEGAKVLTSLLLSGCAPERVKRDAELMTRAVRGTSLKRRDIALVRFGAGNTIDDQHGRLGSFWH